MTARDREIARYRQEAAELRRQADAALEAKDAAAGLVLIEKAILRETVADGLEAGEGAALPAVPRRRMMGHMEQAKESRELKISRSKSGTRPPEVEALAAAGLTPRQAAEVCGTSRDVLKQAWAKGSQFRPIRPDWAKKLEAKGVPLSTWRKS